MLEERSKLIDYTSMVNLNNKTRLLKYEVLGSVDRVYEAELIEFLVPLVKNGDCFIDVGANVGFYAIAMAQHVESVFAVEPCQETCEVLTRNCLRNQVTNCEVLNLALSDYDGDADLFIMGRSGGSNTLSSEVARLSPLPPMRSTPVAVRKGDTVFGEKRIDLIKIDVEGLEFSVLKGFERLIRKDNPLLLIEIWPEKRLEVERLLKELAYDVWFAFPKYPDMAVCKSTALN